MTLDPKLYRLFKNPSQRYQSCNVTMELVNRQCPNYWWQLSEADKCAYLCLRSAIFDISGKSQRNRRLETFSEVIDSIKAFAVRGDEGDSVRCAACGISWLPEGLAINTHQLCCLVGKCKSSINGSLQKLGYGVNMGRGETIVAICAAFPFLRDTPGEIRKWTVRRKEDPVRVFSPVPMLSSQSKCVFEISLTGLLKPEKEIQPLDLSYEMPMEESLGPECENPMNLPLSYLGDEFDALL